jgi:AraC-like DNA-binding protein
MAQSTIFVASSTNSGLSSVFIMDILSEVLRQAGLRRRLMSLRVLPPRTELRFACSKGMALHIAMQGPIYVHAASFAVPLRLDSGDVTLMAPGCHHTLSREPELVQPFETLSAAWVERHVQSPPESGEPSVFSGAYQLRKNPVHSLFDELPDWFVVRTSSSSCVGSLPRLLADEVQRGPHSSELIIHGLLDAIASYILRAMVANPGLSRAGFRQALSDQKVPDAVALMNDECAHPWTLEELAARSGMSRTAFAERFREAMGDTPLAYLRSVRMRLAKQILSETEKTIEEVARAVGYGDASTFSRAFKRSAGVAPNDFRSREWGEKRSSLGGAPLIPSPDGREQSLASRAESEVREGSSR